MFQDYCSAHGKPCLPNSLYCSEECKLLDQQLSQTLVHDPEPAASPLLYECSFCSNTNNSGEPCIHQQYLESESDNYYVLSEKGGHRYDQNLVFLGNDQQLGHDLEQGLDNYYYTDDITSNDYDENNNYDYENDGRFGLDSRPHTTTTTSREDPSAGSSSFSGASAATFASSNATYDSNYDYSASHSNNTILDTLMEFDKLNKIRDSNYVQLNYKKWLVNLSPSLS